MMVSAPAAAATPMLNFDDDRAPNPTITEDVVTISKHDVGEMDGPLDYYDDEGEVASLPATYNMSQDTPVGVRFDKVAASAFNQFPRIDGENGNSANWTDSTHWTTNADASVTDADTADLERVEVDLTAAGGNATLAKNVSITSDAEKRVLMFVGSVDALGGSTEVQVRAVDGDGDYRYANISSSAMGKASGTIANKTGNGFVFQERLSDLPMAGSGDSTMDGIQRIEIVATGGSGTMTITGLDVDRKSTIDIAEIERDTDGDGEDETVVFEDYWEGGTAKLTGLDTLGETFDSAEIMDLEVYDVHYRLADLTDESEYMVEFSSADEYSYPEQVELYADLEVPSAIDLTHGSLSLDFSQGLPGERYVVAEVAEDVDSAEPFGNLSDDDYTNVVSSIDEQGAEHVLDASVSADQTYRVHMTILLQSEEVDDLQSSGMSGGPLGGGGGFFSTIYGQIAGLVAAVAGAIGLNRLRGGS
jgi:hypothetical protein